MGMTGGSDEGGLNAEINVTPMIDVMLVLLVIFMATAPMLTTGVDIDLPKTQAKKEITDTTGISVLSITGKGKVLVMGDDASWQTLRETLVQKVKPRKDEQGRDLPLELYIEADQNLPYRLIVTAMAVAKDAGIEKVMMLTDPVQTLDLKTLDAKPL